MAGDLKACLDELGIRKAHVVALRLAAKYRQYVDKLVSVCGYSVMPVRPGVLLWLGNVIHSLISLQVILPGVDPGLQLLKARELTRHRLRFQV